MGYKELSPEQETLKDDLTNYLEQNNPMEFGSYQLQLLPAAEYHQNFTIEKDGITYVVRLSTMQLSRKENQLAEEYKYLEYLSKFGMAPKPYYIDMQGFTYPFLIEEFVAGPVFSEPTPQNLDKCADALVALYDTPLNPGHPFETRTPSYQADLDYFLGVYKEYEGSDAVSHWASRVRASTDNVADALTPLEEILKNVEPKLIRRDANPHNLIDTGERFRWVDWEVARVDDPVVTLASFINETELYDWFNPKLQPEQREIVTTRFLNKTKIPHGRELLQARLLLERYWGMIWAIERIYKHKNGELPDHLSTQDRLDRYEFIASQSYDALKQDLSEMNS